MQTTIGHLVFSVQPANMPFYKDLLSFLGWQTLYDVPEMLGLQSGDVSLWFMPVTKDVANDYDGPGLNHLGIAAESIADVDATVVYLSEHSTSPLFSTPRHRPEFTTNPDETYYQVMFETPDRILIEVVYTGPK